MERLKGDIWDLGLSLGGDCSIVVPTNVGWRADGRNVMGRGIARAAARRFPGLADAYGQHCQRLASSVSPAGGIVPFVWSCGRGNRWCRQLLLLPVKPLNAEKPYLSWHAPASLKLIEESLRYLQTYVNSICTTRMVLLMGQRVFVPFLGCGNGQLDPAHVIPVIERMLENPLFCLVEPPQ